jgi:hypothetical protein
VTTGIYLILRKKGAHFMEFDVINVISQVGFPIAVATYSLVVLNKTVQKNTEVMTKIATKMGIETDDGKGDK